MKKSGYKPTIRRGAQVSAKWQPKKGDMVRILPGAEDSDGANCWANSHPGEVVELVREDADGDWELSFGSFGFGFICREWFVKADESTETVRYVTPQEAFKPGNVIRFTVEDVSIRGGRVSRGCKTASPDVMDAALSMVRQDDGNFTVRFEAEVKPARGGIGPHVEGGGATISVQQTANYLFDIEIVKEAAPPDVELTLSAEEADALTAVLGKCRIGSPLGGVYDRLLGEEFGSQGWRKYRVDLGGSIVVRLR